MTAINAISAAIHLGGNDSRQRPRGCGDPLSGCT
jgi:hypothetical protein